MTLRWKPNPLQARPDGRLEESLIFPYSFLMESSSPLPPRPPRDRYIAIGMIALAALLASGWIMRERKLSTDLAESREDLRQAMHRLQTLSSSTDQIRVAYLQRKQELDVTKQKLAQAASQPANEKNKAPATPEEKSKMRQAVVTFSSHLAQGKLPSWAAVEKSDTAIRLLPGASLPTGNQGYANFGSIAQLLSSLDPDWTLELIARAEPGKDGWETAQDRARLLMEAAEKSLEGNPARLRLRIEVVKGPRMEWRLLPPEAPANPASENKAPKK